ncbi:hypothetical protein B0H12DRAFT_1076399 [Mycena haematopus]|nr:hypothetical protein B0H12DRAFT_1076399 [Mycena haematopus]
MFHDISEMKKGAEIMHKELLELISTMSETDTTSDKSSVHLGTNELKNSSNSFSLLPSKPKIFYGRETEVENIIKMLGQQAPRIAILGGGGMGKTSLARAVLHHLDTLTRFEQRFFVSAESATTSVELAALIGLHIGLNPGKDLTRPVVQYFSRRSSCLLILDNLETVWEPAQSRSGVEEFLALLTAIKHLGLIITMRGAERPAKVQWTHPFLSPLQSLSDDAAQQTFMDITDHSYAIKDLNQLLSFTDNMPLAVDLISHLVDYEGLENVLARWKTEKTSMLSVGYNRMSNVDASIQLSLSSPRITSESKELLSLLSILPNGLSDAELVQSKLPISNILSCKAILLATSLAYQNSNKRLLALVPIREHIQQFLPPSLSLVHSLRKHFYALMQLSYNQRGEQIPVINQITLNLANLQEVLQQGLDNVDSDLADTIYCVIHLAHFYRFTSRGVLPLMACILHILSGTSDHRLVICFLTEVLNSPQYYHHIFSLEELIVQGEAHLKHIDDAYLESKFYQAASWFFYIKPDMSHALKFIQRAQELAILSGDNNRQSSVLLIMTQYKIQAGDYYTAQAYARKAQQLSELAISLHNSAYVLLLQAECSTFLGNYQASVVQLHRARKFIEIWGMPAGRVAHRVTLFEAEVHLLKTEYAQANRIFSDILATTSLGQDSEAYTHSLINIAYLDIQIGGSAEIVHKKLNTTIEIHHTLGHFRDMIVCKMTGADLDLREHIFDLAQVKFQECLHSSWGIYNEVQSFCLERLANIKAWPATKLQSKWPMVYLALAYKSKEKLALHKALLFLGDVFIINNNEHTASNLYIVALEGFTYMDVHQKRAECMLRLGDLANKQGNTSVAINHWKMARPLFERSLQAKNVAQIDSRLAALDKAQEEALVKLKTL